VTGDRRLAAWRARDLATHLEELASQATAWRDGKGELAVVTLHLASGQRHVGVVLEVARGTVALQSLPQRGTADLDVTVVPIARIEALTLHAARATEATAVVEVATSTLELRRRAKALVDQLAVRIGTAIPIELGAGELAQLAPTLEALRTALDHVCSDDLGRGALVERVRRIELRGGATELELAGGLLVISGSFAPEQLQRRLDAAL
jgi:hypothetical protein